VIKKRVLRAARITEDVVRRTLRLKSSPQTLEQQAQDFWSRPLNAKNNFWWHARGSTPFADADDKWLRIGTRHTDLWEQFARAMSRPAQVDRALDYGCGCGANAIAYGKYAKTLWGVDINADALAEAKKQVDAAGTGCDFKTLQIQVQNPEAIVEQTGGNLDLFLCLYVMQSLPSPEYGLRVVKLAHDMLRPGGLAIFQIQYITDFRTLPRAWAYSRAAASMTSYRLDDFWQQCEQIGFIPHYTHLLPAPPEVPNVRYAYFMLEKPGR
jgi:SAM-dependent methyltransferase